MDYSEYIGFHNSPLEDRKILRDSRGSQRTESLFVEVIQPSSRGKYIPLYSLKDYENKGLPSAYHIYMGSIDETEAALKLVGSLVHWRKLTKLKWFLVGRPEHAFEGLNSWRRDMADRDRSEAKRVILDQCKADNVTAARALDKLARDAAKAIPNTVVKSRVESEEDSVIVSLINSQ